MPYRFRSPSYRVARQADRFWRRKLDTVNLTLVLKDGRYSTVEEPTNEELDAADRFWLGGYDHLLSDTEALDLIAAGYGEFLSYIEITTPPPPPPPDPGTGGGTDPGTGGGGTPTPTGRPYGTSSYGTGSYGP